MWKILGVALLSALGTGLVMNALRSESPAGDAAQLDIARARIAELEAGRAGADPARGPILIPGTPIPIADPEEVTELRKQLAAQKQAFEQELAELREANAQKPQPRPMRRGPRVRRKPTPEEAKADFEKKLAAIGEYPDATRHRALYSLGMELNKTGFQDLAEAAYRALLDDAGTDDDLAKEGAYQIGWTRVRRGDYRGAREAWLEARDNFDRGHWRHDYARYYAAKSAYDMKADDDAARELEALIRDLENERSDHAQKGTILQRSKDLLSSLRK